MLKLRQCPLRLLPIVIFVLSLCLFVFFNNQTRDRTFSFELSSTSADVDVSSSNISECQQNTNEKSLYARRSNERLIRLGRRFAHINIDLLLSTQASSHQTMTYLCAKYCGGWGDRLRGIASTYILAVLLRRRFVIDMRYPCDLSTFLQPNLINWTSITHVDNHQNRLQLDPMHNEYRVELHSNISNGNLTKLWAFYDNVLLTTNSDYIGPALQNPFFNSTASLLKIRSDEATQWRLFPLIFELLFKPTRLITEEIDTLLSRASSLSEQPIVCMHFRTGRNPSIPQDHKFLYRTSLVDDMVAFVDKNLSRLLPPIFVTSDSAQIQQDVADHYGPDRLLTVAGSIIHIDRFNSRLQSRETIYRGFLKVIADFYILGECPTIVMSHSGFSDLANRRRTDEYANTYLYCRGVHRVTGPRWRRPHVVC